MLWASTSWSNVCTVSATDMNFGIYNPASPTPNDITSTITVTCLKQLLPLFATYTVKLTKGSGSYTGRTLRGPSNQSLVYNLYTNPTRTQVWGDGTSGTAYNSHTLYFWDGIFQDVETFTVYGRIGAGQNKPPGTYIDVITVNVSF